MAHPDGSLRERGDPTHKTRKMRALEREYSGDIRQIIQDFRTVAGGNSWRTVAGILGVDYVTLWHWRKALGMEVGYPGCGGYADPLSYPLGFKTNSLEHRARARGYTSSAEWVLELRLVTRLSRDEAAAVLGVHPATVTAHTPEVFRGRIDQWRERRSDAE